jgi:hypothetical protein
MNKTNNSKKSLIQPHTSAPVPPNVSLGEGNTESDDELEMRALPDPQPVKPKQKRQISDEQRAILRERIKHATACKIKKAEERKAALTEEMERHQREKEARILEAAEKLKRRNAKELKTIDTGANIVPRQKKAAVPPPPPPEYSEGETTSESESESDDDKYIVIAKKKRKPAAKKHHKKVKEVAPPPAPAPEPKQKRPPNPSFIRNPYENYNPFPPFRVV